MSMRLGLGTATLVGRRTIRDARKLIEDALDVGINHFDTARMYGFGESERVVGDVLAGVDGVTVTSKAGLGKAVHRRGRWRIDFAAAAVVRVSPKKPRATPIEMGWDRPYLEQSIQTSLRLLRRDTLDYLLLHEIAHHEWSDDVQRIVKAFIDSGRVGAMGLATRFVEIEKFVASGSLPGTVCQYASGPLQPTIRIDGVPTKIWHSIFGPGGQALERFVKWLQCDSSAGSLWKEPTGSRDVGLHILRYIAATKSPAILILPARHRESMIRAVEAVQNPLPRDEIQVTGGIFNRFRQCATDWAHP